MLANENNNREKGSLLHREIVPNEAMGIEFNAATTHCPAIAP